MHTEINNKLQMYVSGWSLYDTGTCTKYSFAQIFLVNTNMSSLPPNSCHKNPLN